MARSLRNIGAARNFGTHPRRAPLVGEPVRKTGCSRDRGAGSSWWRPVRRWSSGPARLPARWLCGREPEPRRRARGGLARGGRGAAVAAPVAARGERDAGDGERGADRPRARGRGLPRSLRAAPRGPRGRRARGDLRWRRRAHLLRVARPAASEARTVAAWGGGAAAGVRCRLRGWKLALSTRGRGPQGRPPRHGEK